MTPHTNRQDLPRQKNGREPCVGQVLWNACVLLTSSFPPPKYSWLHYVVYPPLWFAPPRIAVWHTKTWQQRYILPNALWLCALHAIVFSFLNRTGPPTTLSLSNRCACSATAVLDVRVLPHLFSHHWLLRCQLLRSHYCFDSTVMKRKYGTLEAWCLLCKTEVLAEKSVAMPFCPPRIPCRLIWHQTLASLVTNRRRIAWTVARPSSLMVSLRSAKHCQCAQVLCGQ